MLYISNPALGLGLIIASFDKTFRFESYSFWEKIKKLGTAKNFFRRVT